MALILVLKENFIREKELNDQKFESNQWQLNRNASKFGKQKIL